MAKSTDLTFTQNVNFKAVTFTNADAASTLKSLYTAAANDAVVKGLLIRSDETATARVFDVLVNDGTTDYVIGAVNVPVNAGFNGTVAAVDALASALFPGLPIDATGKRILPLKTGHSLKIRTQTQPTSGKTLTVSAIIEEY